MLEIGVEERGVEPWGKLVDGGREGCDRGSIVEDLREKETGQAKDWAFCRVHETIIERVPPIWAV